jgi:hypothetical protein
MAIPSTAARAIATPNTGASVRRVSGVLARVRRYRLQTTPAMTASTRRAPAGRMTASTKPGSRSSANSALPGQFSTQLVYGLGTLKLSATIS